MSWQTRSPDGSTGRIEPSDTRVLATRAMGVVVAALAHLMLVANFAFIH